MDKFLDAVPSSTEHYSELPVPGARFLVGPYVTAAVRRLGENRNQQTNHRHAGYSFAGSTLAETYKAWDTKGMYVPHPSLCFFCYLTTNLSKRVFILGPSHHVYFQGARLTPFSVYETPLGNVPVDRESKFGLEVDAASQFTVLMS